MGIYIDMEMPNGHPVCIVIDAAGQARRYDLNNDRYADDKLFEAISVPPHGRTIDADVLYETIKKERDRISKSYGDNDEYVQCLNKYAMSMIISAPTILPADRLEE